MQEEYTNRYGDKILFVDNEDGTISMTGGKYLRYGGKSGQNKMDINDLGMVDPSGGPYIGIGSKVLNREILKISINDDESITLGY